MIVPDYINKGEFIGKTGLFTPESSRSVKAHTRVPCKVAEITDTRLNQLLDTKMREHSKDRLFAIGRQLGQRLRETSGKVGHLTFFDISGRIARTLGLNSCQAIQRARVTTATSRAVRSLFEMLLNEGSRSRANQRNR